MADEARAGANFNLRADVAEGTNLNPIVKHRRVIDD
jgi:hypothetical protein